MKGSELRKKFWRTGQPRSILTGPYECHIELLQYETSCSPRGDTEHSLIYWSICLLVLCSHPDLSFEWKTGGLQFDHLLTAKKEVLLVISPGRSGTGVGRKHVLELTCSMNLGLPHATCASWHSKTQALGTVSVLAGHLDLGREGVSRTKARHCRASPSSNRGLQRGHLSSLNRY